MKFSMIRPLLSFLFIYGSFSSVLPRGGDDAGGHPWINHNEVTPFTQSPSPGIEGQLELRFKPFLFVSGGCDPYPAVAPDGSLGAGLKPTGGGRDGCDAGGTAQVFVRRGQSLNRTGIMYSYYMPKVRWGKGDNDGHRHYWASVVVWVNQFGCIEDDTTSYHPVGVSFTNDHLSWDTAATGKISYSGSQVGVDQPTHPRVQIHDIALSSFVGADGDKVFERTVVAWGSLSKEAENALSDIRYEKTQVPFIDDNFQTQLDAAYRESFYGGIENQKGCSSSTEPHRQEIEEPDIIPEEEGNQQLPKPPPST
ncbi:NPP1 domain-containing protein [Colletotrichum camelliae]|nr:NPP1 domain-containing protein [Colletotrichum camelliae]